MDYNENGPGYAYQEPLEVTMARIETKLDNVINDIGDQESRLRKVEGFRVWLLGAAAAVSFFVTQLKFALLPPNH